MKLSLARGLAIFGTAVFLVGCNKPQPVAEEPKSAPPAPAVEETPAAPEPVADTQTPAVVEDTTPQYAPKGIYFIRERVSVETPDGVTSLRPGTRVVESDGRYLVNGQFLKIPADKLTNDMRLAKRLAEQNAGTRVNQAPRAVTPAPATPAPAPAPQ